MSLKHNPFDNTYKGALIKRKKVFETSNFDSSVNSQEAVPGNLTESARAIQGHYTKNKEATEKLSRESLESKQRKPSKLSAPKTVSRESPVPNLENIERVSRDSLDKTTDIHRVVGLQKKILTVVFSILQSKGSRLTPPVAIGLISERASTSIANAQNAIKELIKKKLLVRKDFQRGRGGWTIYEIEESIYIQLDQEKVRDSLENLQRVSSIQIGGKSRDTAPCSSSDLSLNLNNTTTEDIWINIPPFLKGQLPIRQITKMVNQGLVSEEVLDDSLWGFAFDLEKGLVKSKSGNTTAVFIGALKNGGYISQHYLQQKKLEEAEIASRHAELLRIREDSLARKYSEEFEKFSADFPDEAEKLKPANQFFKNFDKGSIGYKLWLENFKKKIAT